jgi:hypothetical protein
MFWVQVCVDGKPFRQERVQDPDDGARKGETFWTEYAVHGAPVVDPRPATVLWEARDRQCILSAADDGYELYLRHKGYTTRLVICPTQDEAIRMAAEWYTSVQALPLGE